MLDEFGNFVQDHTKWLSTVLEVKEGEAYALLQAMKCLEQLLYNAEIFETDWKTLVENLRDGGISITKCGVILKPYHTNDNAHPGFMVQFNLLVEMKIN